jgi:hypothetical protein
MGFIAGLFIYSRIKYLRPIVLLLGLTFVSEIASRFFAKYLHNSNPVYHFFNPLQVVLLGCFFYMAVEKPVLKKGIMISIMGMLVFSVLCSVFINGLMIFPEYFLNVSTFVVIIWATILFIQILDLPAEQNIFKKPVFVISMAILWFYLFAFSFVLLHNYFLKHNVSSKYIGILHYYSNIIYYTLLLTAMILAYSSLRNERKIKY